MPTPPDPDPFHDHDHDACSGAVLEHALTRLEAEGARLTPVRRRTLEILLESHRAMGAYDVLQRLSAEGFGSQPPVAYRALEFLVNHGLVHRVQRLNAYAACLSPQKDHSPVFLICRGCDKVAETGSSDLRAAIGGLATSNRFTVERTTVEILGLCSQCVAAGAEVRA